MSYSSVVYRGYKLDPSDASTYTFTSCDIGTESPLRAVLVGVVLGGTTMSAITANVTINGYSASRLVMTQASISHIAFFIARVPLGTSVNIVVQASAAGSARAAIVWYTFKPESLSIRDFAGATSAAATSVTATDLDIVTDGVLFSLAYNASSGTSYSYNGTDSLIANASNIQLETAVNAHFSTHHTLTSQTISTNDITSTGVSEPRSILAISFNTEAFFSDTVAETTSFTEGVSRVYQTGSSISDLISLADITRDTPITSYSDTMSEAVSGAETYTRVVTYPHAVNDTLSLGYFTSFTENISASDVIRISDRLITAPGVTLSDTISTGDTLVYAYKLGPEMIERLNLTTLVGPKMTAMVLVAESTQGRDMVVVAHPRTMSEAVTLSHTVTAIQATRIIERLGLTETLLGPRKIGQTTAETLRLSDVARRFFGGDLVDGVNFSDAASRLRRALASSSETVALSETVARKLVLRITAAEAVEITQTEALKMTLSRTVVEGVEVSAAYVAPNGSITTWAVNTRNGAVTEYSNYSFNSFAKLNSKYFGAADAGLYELTGDDDAGTDIIAQIKSGFAQFGGSRFTSFKAAYLGMRGSGDFVLKIETGDGKTYNYAVVGKDMETTKVHMGKGLRARYFAFELISTGQDFDLDDIEFMPLVAQRRV